MVQVEPAADASAVGGVGEDVAAHALDGTFPYDGGVLVGIHARDAGEVQDRLQADVVAAEELGELL